MCIFLRIKWICGNLREPIQTHIRKSKGRVHTSTCTNEIEPFISCGIFQFQAPCKKDVYERADPFQTFSNAKKKHLRQVDICKSKEPF